MCKLVLGFIILFVIGCLLYKKFGWFKIIYHDTLDWHEPISKESRLYKDNVNDYSICKYCGKHIIKDSQGNWF